ncbi:winged helix-turn-helix transcriptional regulator [Streptomyces sp. NPDC015032]|uniref:winged helix-turn-helix transcriptional regulator n=1 Tax=Streptomyces sp. NPDC015032 TaxID=3364937 RepID=UPI0036FD2656
MGKRIEDCPLARAVEYIGDWWTLELLHEAFDGRTRFEEFQQNLKTPDGLLTQRLDALVGNGIMERRPDHNDPPRDEYVLTELGRSLRPVIVTLAAWGNHRLGPAERGMILVDSRTGEEVEPVVVDRGSGHRVDTADYAFTAGPAASCAMLARYQK